MKRLAFIAALALALSACKQSKPKHADEHDHEEGAQPSGGHDEGHDESHVHIAPEMLRDLRVTTAPAAARPGGDSVNALGELTFSEDAYAEVASPISARVGKVFVTTGQHVIKGEQLAEMSSPELGKARAILDSALARQTVARQAVARKRALAAERIVAWKDVQTAEVEASAAEAEVVTALTQIVALGARESEAGVPNFILRAPIRGTVIERAARLGQMAGAEHTLFRIGNLDALWLIVHAFERDAVRMRLDTEARITFAAFPGKEVIARVAHVGQRVDAASRTIPVRLVLDNPEGLFKPGMSATASIPLGNPDGTITTVPAAALQRLENGWVVFLPTGERGSFERRQVGRGRTLGDHVEVLSGLRVGEQVVVDGAFLLKAEVEKSAGGTEHHGH